eukprot:c1729_g1_i1.p1 GENE.c1729_g1_i1~~c1729_g1_i1.p1  ORF type:complete len:660 (+),score=47.26 c1729_g1_i1:33-2012(+)
MREWFNEVFHDKTPLSHFGTVVRHHSLNEVKMMLSKHASEIRVIDNPTKNLAFSLIQLDPAQIAKDILETCEMDASDRDKPLFATIRGVGGGKTRCIEEIREHLHTVAGVLPLAITFNIHWNLNYAEIDFWKNCGLSGYAMAVVARMASVLYGLPLSDICFLLSNKIETLQRDIQFKDVAFIVSFIAHAVQVVRNFFQTAVDTFVLLIDESARAESLLDTQDPHAVVRDALLNAHTLFSEIGIRTSLVMSSLTLSPLGVSPSGRTIRPIVLPGRLPADDVMSQWLQKDIVNLSETDKVKLRVIIESINNLPRLLTILATHLHATPITMDVEAVKAIFERLALGMRDRYPGIHTNLSPFLLRAVVFRQSVRLCDDEVMVALQRSVVTNSVSTFDESASIVPEASFLVLSQLNSMLQPILESLSSSSDQGDVLAEVLHKWMRFRLHVSVGHDGPSSLSLLTLFGCQYNILEQSFLGDTDLLLPSRTSSIISALKTGHVPDTHKNVPAFFQGLADLTCRKEVGVTAVLQAANGSAFDVVLIGVDASDKKQFVVFIDANSSSPLQNEEQLTSRLPSNGSQFSYTCTLQQEATKWLANNKFNGVVEAIANGRFCCVHFSPHGGRSVTGVSDKEITSTAPIVLRRDVTEPFLGPVWGVYRALGKV